MGGHILNSIYFVNTCQHHFSFVVLDHMTFIFLLLRIWPTIWHLFFYCWGYDLPYDIYFLLLRIWPTIWHLFFYCWGYDLPYDIYVLLLRIWPTIWHLFFICWGYDLLYDIYFLLLVCCRKSFYLDSCLPLYPLVYGPTHFPIDNRQKKNVICWGYDLLYDIYFLLLRIWLTIWILFFICWGYNLPYNIYFFIVEDMTYYMTFIFYCCFIL
jgi:hypothetical protein